MTRTLGRSTARRHDARWAVLLLLPAAIFFVVFWFGPGIATFALSATDWNLLTPPRFVGLDNFVALVQDTAFLSALRTTALFTVVVVAVKIVLGFVLAWFLWTARWGRIGAFIESSLFFPLILPMAVVALLWGLLFNTDFGVVNATLESLGLPAIPWLTSAAWALPSLMLLDIWKSLGFFVVVFAVGLRAIPSDILEAAQLDGAGAVRRAVSVVLPLVSPTTVFLVAIGLIDGLKMFDQAYVLTRGGPGDVTRTVVYYTWEKAFQSLDAGYASTLSVVLFAIMLGLTVLQFRLSSKWVHYA